MSIKSKLEQTKTNGNSVTFNDGPSGIEMGLKLDKVVDFVKANRNFLRRVKQEGLYKLKCVTDQEMKLRGKKKTVVYLDNCLEHDNYDGWLQL